MFIFVTVVLFPSLSVCQITGTVWNAWTIMKYDSEINNIQQNATVCRYLFTAKPLHMWSDFAVNKYLNTVASCWILLIWIYDARTMNIYKKNDSKRQLWQSTSHIQEGRLLIRKQQTHVTITRAMLCTRARARDFSLLRNLQNGCVAHSAGVTFLARVKRPGNEADHLPPSIVEVKNKWSYTSIPLVCLCGVYKHNFPLHFDSELKRNF